MKFIYNNLTIFLLTGFLLTGILSGCGASRPTPPAEGKGKQEASQQASNTTMRPSLSELFKQAGLSYMGNKGIEAPDFSVKSIDGKPIKLSDFRGKVVFLNFWATWCPPCRAEMPSIETLYTRYKRQTLQVLAVNVQEESSVVKTFLAQNLYTFPIVLDPNGEAARLYGIRGIPTTFIIDQQGNLQGALVGGKAWDTPEVFALLDALLKNSN